MQGKWQQERLPSANCYEELQQYGPEVEEDGIDVSDHSAIRLEDLLDQEFIFFPPPYTELEEKRNIAHYMDIRAVQPKPRMEETVNNTALHAVWSPEVECQYLQAADGEPLD